ncbi:MAG: hypothetical protein ACD_13C00021G0024 [uncultured bacterium]|nr:MAG: hypothetical protein ACD_13C00021G0024 [uncultured bacterium]HAU64986.1 hypothetical protein [Candidatus Woesebacteria bacterium]HCC08846.1 hypothetical protein [Candidatus Woesebacteria bacterium]
MSTSKECPLYNECGFVKWRIERPDSHIPPLPKDGDCGKPAVTCGRLEESHPVGISLSVTDYGPKTYEEIVIGFPEIPNENGRPPRRLVGSGSG